MSVPSIELTQIPDFGSSDKLRGLVTGVRPSDVRVAVYTFVPDIGWSSKPSCGQILSSVDPDGTWSVDIAPGLADKYANRISVYLLPASYTPECAAPAVGVSFATERIALAKVKIERPDPAPKTVNFSGLEWIVKSGPIKTYPGPNYFVDTQDNVWVDTQGRLHLRVTRCNFDAWCSAEVYTRDTLGYGTYRFSLDTPVHDFDPNLVLGLFTWSQNADFNNREMDIEFSRWGNVNDPQNAQFVVQPYDSPSHLHRFAMRAANTSTHQFQWSPTSISFISQLSPGAFTPGVSSTIEQWSYPQQAGVPPVGDAQLHINLYLQRGQIPYNVSEREVIISRLDYIPSGPSLSLSSTSASLPFTSASGRIDVSATDSSCAWSATSNVPWIKILSGESGYGSGSINFQALDNPGNARNGTISFGSQNCNLTPGRQRFAVTQAAVSCGFSANPSDTFTDFRERILSFYLKATSSACRWTVQSGAPWISLQSANTGSGDVTIQYKIAANQSKLARQGAIAIGPQLHRVNQDGSESVLIGSPNPARACDGASTATMGLNWSTFGASSVEIRAGSPTGTVVGRFGPNGGTTTGNWVIDGLKFYLQSADSGDSSGSDKTLASFQAKVSSEGCGTRGPVLAAGGISNAASFASGPLAPGQIATIFGQNLTKNTVVAQSNPLPTELDGASVRLNGQPVPLFFVSPNQINFYVPDDVPTGRTSLSVGTLTAEAAISATAPGLFTVAGTGQGVPFAAASRISADGTQTALPVYQCGDNASSCRPSPLDLGQSDDQVVLILYGTGIRGRSNLSAVRCTIATENVEVLYAGPQPTFVGLDQVNVKVPRTLVGRGDVGLVLNVDGRQSNVVLLSIR